MVLLINLTKQIILYQISFLYLSFINQLKKNIIMAFKLVSKNYKHSKPTFWVEGYTDAEKLIFEKMGFVERVVNMPVSFGNANTLEFKGSGMFGMFTPNEFDTLSTKIRDAFKLKKLVVYESKEW